MGHINVKDLLDVYQCSCGSFCVLLLTDSRLKDNSKDGLCLHFSKKGRFLRQCVMHGIKRRTQKLGHDILPCVSNFRRSECDSQFCIGKKPS